MVHEPVQFDVVAVSGPNQYTVKPPALVSTVAPPIVAVFSVVPDGAAPDVLLELDELAELPQAAIISAAEASPAGASQGGASAGRASRKVRPA